MIVTGDNTPAHVSDMGAWAPVIPVAVGPYETGGVMMTVSPMRPGCVIES